MPDDEPKPSQNGPIEHSTEPPILEEKEEQDELVPPGEIEELVKKHEPPPAPPPAPPEPPKVAVKDGGGWWLWASVGLLTVTLGLAFWWVWRTRIHEDPGPGSRPAPPAND